MQSKIKNKGKFKLILFLKNTTTDCAQIKKFAANFTNNLKFKTNRSKRAFIFFSGTTADTGLVGFV